MATHVEFGGRASFAHDATGIANVRIGGVARIIPVGGSRGVWRLRGGSTL